MSIEYKEDLNSLKRKLFLSVFLLIAAIAIPVVSYCAPFWAPVTETDASWFQRSGSAVVILTALAEYMLFKTYDYISPNEAAMFVPFDTPRWFKHVYNISSGIAHSLLIIGTVIWGYGDIIHEKI